MELDVIRRMDDRECTVDVSGLSLPPIYKFGAVEEGKDVPPTLTASERGLFVFKCLVIVLYLFIRM